MKHLALLAAAGSLAVFAAPAQAAELPAAPASATIFAGYDAASHPVSATAGYDRDRWDDRRDRRRWNDRRYRDDRRWRDQRGGYWRGDDGRWRCRRDDGTTGLLIGAGVGALLGREVDRRGDRTLGTVLGAVGGGLLGREIDRGDVRCR